MLNNKKIGVVLPAYNAEKTLKKTYDEIPLDIVDSIILVDDKSTDNTLEISKNLSIKTYLHDKNLGYGANQKTCYRKALEQGNDIIVMLHPDYQYTPRLVTAMVSMLAYGVYDVVLASRILGHGAVKEGMPVYKYIGNRILTFLQNICVGRKHTEYHTGYRAFTREVLEWIPFEKNSDDFVFDNQILVQIIAAGYHIGEISCPAKYFEEASSINLFQSIKYGFGCLYISFRYLLHRLHILKCSLFVTGK
jgi:glycosyltransferase involved in cell wall biosynthesis